MKPLAKIALTAAGFFGLYKVYEVFAAYRVGTQMDIIMRSRIHKVSLKGVEVRTEVRLQNPTKHQLRLTQPFIRLLNNKYVLASSKVQSTVFTLKPMSAVNLNSISLLANWLTVIELLFKLKFKFPANTNFIQKITHLISNYSSIFSKLKLAVQYSTYANGIFYSSTQEIEL